MAHRGLRFIVIYLNQDSRDHGWGAQKVEHPHVFSNGGFGEAIALFAHVCTNSELRVVAPFGYRGSLRLAALLAVRFRRDKAVVTRSDSNHLALEHEGRLKRLSRQIVLRAAFPARTRVWTVGEANESFWREYVGRSNTHRIPYSTPQLPDSQGSVPPRSPSSPERLTFLYVGRLVAVKKVGDLIAAFRTNEAPGWRLVIVGDGPLRAKLEQAAADDGRIHFEGAVEYRELDRYYREADVLVLPSSYEPWGLVVNEALAFGLRVIVSDRVGARTVLTSRDAVVTCGDIKGLALAMTDSVHFLDRVQMPPSDPTEAMMADLNALVVR